MKWLDDVTNAADLVFGAALSAYLGVWLSQNSSIGFGMILFVAFLHGLVLVITQMRAIRRNFSSKNFAKRPIFLFGLGFLFLAISSYQFGDSSYVIWTLVVGWLATYLYVIPHEFREEKNE